MLLACPECDALQHEPLVSEHGTEDRAVCWRCGAILIQGVDMQIERMFALTLTALILFVLANAFPLFALDLQGVHHITSLFGAVDALWSKGMHLVALLVFATTILFPAVEISALLYLLLVFHARAENEAPFVMGLLRIISVLRPWGMIEVLMLGALVSMVKLSHIAAIHPGVALWSMGAVMLLLAAVSSRFDARQLWARLEHTL